MRRVSVVMPVYNASKNLEAAIRSILDQTYFDFEFLILDDGSTDDSARIIESFSDPRINFIRSEFNRGLIATLNYAFTVASGEYLVRMDSDDISVRTRIEKQIRYLDLHPEIGVVGTFCRTIGAKTEKLRFPIDHENIHIHALFECPIAHPTVVIRRAQLPTPTFDSRFVHAEDYELWTRLLDRGVRFYTLPEVLLYYRVHDDQVSTRSRADQLAVGDLVRAHWLLRLGLTLTNEEMLMHRMVAHSSYEARSFDPISVSEYLEKLRLANEIHSVFEHRCFTRELGFRELYAFSKAYKLSEKQFLRMTSSRLWRPSFFLKKAFFKTFFSCLLGFFQKEHTP